MSSQQLDEEAIFQVARLIAEPEGRAAYLEQACAGDQSLRERVDALLEAHEQESKFLKSSPDAAPTADHKPITEGPGQQIGRFKLLQQIGEGGFGVVYMAEQVRPVRRKVALKIIKPGMDTHAVVARFEAERQALAMMDHPNIARVLDGGATDSGRPFFVMELVKGVPITEYCDKNHSPTNERLELFTVVCQAVQHAHQKGIIHRDLKPSNILVTLADGKPVVKVIDFGVSKALNQQLTEKTLFTAYGQMIGTPQYMSPEQAEMSCLDVDTRSDIYSLGVVLYELLTGTTPLEGELLRTAGFVEMQRIIQEEEPPKPSVRLSTSGQRLTVLAKHRSVTPERLRKIVRGDLDWIVMKSLEKDRHRRYETAAGLANDMMHFLRSEPVTACPPSASYRLRKFARRNKAAAIMMPAIVLAVLAGMSGITFGWLSAVRKGLETRAALDRERQLVAERDASLTREQSLRVTSQEAENEARTSLRERNRQRYISDMHAAKLAWNESHIPRVMKLLRRHIPRTVHETDHRGFEWYYLRRICEPFRATDEIELPGAGRAVSFSPHGKQLAVSLAYSPAVITWDLETKQRLKSWKTRERFEWKRTFVAYSTDGSRIAHEGDDLRSVVVRNTDTGQVETTVRHDGIVREAVFGQTSDVLASLGTDDMVRIWHLPSGEEIQSYAQETAVCLAVSPQSAQTVALANSDGEVVIWDWMSNTVKKNRVDGGIGNDNPLAFSPDGDSVAIGTYDGKLHVWHLATDEMRTFHEHTHPIYCVAFAPFAEQNLLASAGRDRTVRLWDPQTGEVRQTLRGHFASIMGLAFSPEGDYLASVSLDNTVKLWNVESIANQTQAVQKVGAGAPGYRKYVSFLPGKMTIAALVGGTRRVRFWNANPETELAVDVTSSEVLSCMAISPVGTLATGSIAGEICVWRVEPGTVQKECLASVEEEVSSLAFSSDGHVLAAGVKDGLIQVRDARSGEVLLQERAHEGSVTGMAFSAPSHLLVTGGGDGKVILWDWKQGTELRTLRVGHGGDSLGVAISPDGRLLAVSSYYFGILLQDLEKPERPAHVWRHPAMSVRFSADGRTLVSAGYDSIAIWDVVERELRFLLTGKGSGGGDVELSEDESVLASLNGDGDLRLFRGRAPDFEVAATNGVRP